MIQKILVLFITLLLAACGDDPINDSNSLSSVNSTLNYYSTASDVDDEEEEELFTEDEEVFRQNLIDHFTELLEGLIDLDTSEYNEDQLERYNDLISKAEEDLEKLMNSDELPEIYQDLYDRYVEAGGDREGHPGSPFSMDEDKRQQRRCDNWKSLLEKDDGDEFLSEEIRASFEAEIAENCNQ